jgi:hypothetical protein
MLKEFNKSVSKDKEKGKEHQDAGYNLDPDYDINSLIHHDTEVSTIAK